MSLPATTFYSSPDGFWNPARVTELRQLFDKGLSNQQIAIEMKIRSRNAVIGKLHRLGLRREPMATVSPQSRGARAIGSRVRKQEVPQRVMVAPVRTKHVVREEPEIETDDVRDLEREVIAGRVSLLAAGDKHCRWPAADDGSATMVCGGRIVAGSFCARHALRVFQRPDSPQRRGAGAG